MNIFFLDIKPRLAAVYHCDAHVVKMITETAQLLSTSYWMTEQEWEPPYSPSHWNHPCAQWIRYSKQNWQWTLELGLHLYDEYHYRYGYKQHFGGEVLLSIAQHPPILPDRGLTFPALAMPADCKQSNPVNSYREYYRKYKQHILKYRDRLPPEWLNEEK